MVRALLILACAPLLGADDDAQVRGLLENVKAHEKDLEARLEQYGYKEERIEENNSKQEKRELYEVTFYKGRKVRRLVQRNGQPLPASEMEKENRRVEREVRNLSNGDIPPLSNR